MHKRWVFRIVAGLVIAAAGWWILDEDTVDPVAAPDSFERERTPDYFVEKFTLDATDEQGVRTYRLQGDTMTHFMDEDIWHVEVPWMIYYTESGSPWHLRSERGRAWNSVTEAMLEGDVTIRREASDENLEANIDTSEVYLRPQARYAETDQYAIYYRDGARISGTGVRGYLDRQRIEMLSEVRGVYEPAVD